MADFAVGAGKLNDMADSMLDIATGDVSTLSSMVNMNFEIEKKSGGIAQLTSALKKYSSTFERAGG